MSTNRLHPILDVELDDSNEVLVSEAVSYPFRGRSDFSAVETIRYRGVKRAFDFLTAAILVALFFIPGLIIAGLIRLTSRGSVFYTEMRVGRDGRKFRIWKFRSMCADAPLRSKVVHSTHCDNVLEWRMQKQLKDPRITPLGSFMRATSVDELPQLFNVLRGEMSLVGPRPIIEAELPCYGNLVDYYLSATPGMSGLWQVSGRSNLDYDRRAMLDKAYVTTWSLASDFMILLRTIPAVIQRAGAR